MKKSPTELLLRFCGWQGTAVIAFVVAAVAVLSLTITRPAQAGDEQTLSPAPGVDVYGDALPAGAIARLGTLRYRSEATIYEIAFAADNCTIVAIANSRMGDEKGTFLRFNALTGRLLGDVHFGGDSASQCAISPDGEVAVTHEVSVTPQPGGRPLVRYWLKCWDTASGKELGSIPCDDRGGYIRVSGNDSTFVRSSPNRNAKVSVWDRTTMSETAHCDVADGADDVAVTTDGNTLAFVDRKKGVFLWNFGSAQAPWLVLARPRISGPSNWRFRSTTSTWRSPG